MSHTNFRPTIAFRKICINLAATHLCMALFRISLPFVLYFAVQLSICVERRKSAAFFPELKRAAGMVGSSGLEPPTSRLSGVCSNLLSYEPKDGGGNRDRTDDPLLAGQVLYQLSYTPIYINALSGDNIK